MSQATPECDRTNEHLLDYAYGELSGAPLAELEQHLPGCARCQADLAALKSTRRVMATLAPEAAPAGGLDSLLAYAEQQARRQQKPARPKWLGWLLGAVPVAAAVVIVTSIAVKTNTPATMSPEEAPNAVSVSTRASAEAAPAAKNLPKVEAKPELAATGASEAGPELGAPAGKGNASRREREVAVADEKAKYKREAKKAEPVGHVAASPFAVDGDGDLSKGLGGAAAPAAVSGEQAEQKKALQKEAKTESLQGVSQGKLALDAPKDAQVQAQVAPGSGSYEQFGQDKADQISTKDAVEEDRRQEERGQVVATQNSNVGSVAEAPPPPPAAQAMPTSPMPAPVTAPSAAAGAPAGYADRDEYRPSQHAATRALEKPAAGKAAVASAAEPSARPEALAAAGDHAGAAAAYFAEYQANRGSARGATALFDAASESQKAGLLGQAAMQFERFANEYPRSAYAPGALATAATIRRSQAGEGAATTLEQDLLRRYPDSPEARGLLTRQHAPSRAAPAAPAKKARSVRSDDSFDEVEKAPAPTTAPAAEDAR